MDCSKEIFLEKVTLLFKHIAVQHSLNSTV
jgi:hypothetical protein